MEILLGAPVVDSWWLNPDISAANAAYHRLVKLIAHQGTGGSGAADPSRKSRLTLRGTGIRS